MLLLFAPTYPTTLLNTNRQPAEWNCEESLPTTHPSIEPPHYHIDPSVTSYKASPLAACPCQISLEGCCLKCEHRYNCDSWRSRYWAFGKVHLFVRLVVEDQKIEDKKASQSVSQSIGQSVSQSVRQSIKQMALRTHIRTIRSTKACRLRRIELTRTGRVFGVIGTDLHTTFRGLVSHEVEELKAAIVAFDIRNVDGNLVRNVGRFDVSHGFGVIPVFRML